MNLFSSTKLKYFIAVMEEGSVSKACEKINISRTPLSRAISDLEFCLGFELFTRSKNGMIPNKIRTVVLAILEKYIEFIKKYLHL
ncbi:LysR family transcriptional regulator [Salmonella enterica]|nr:LysR family transcriptional regulator [Salmonella enterica]